MKKTKEPICLVRGKEFHKKIQNNWKRTAQGEVSAERTVLKLNNRKGRVDIFVNDDDPDGIIAIVEIKASNWDIMTDKAVKRNIRRQIHQIYGYIDSQISKGIYASNREHKSVSQGIIFLNLLMLHLERKSLKNPFLKRG